MNYVLYYEWFDGEAVFYIEEFYSTCESAREAYTALMDREDIINAEIIYDVGNYGELY